MQLYWRSSHDRSRRQARTWPWTATQWLLGGLACSLVAQWVFARFWPAGLPGGTALAALSLPGLAAQHLWQPLTYLFVASGPWSDFIALVTLYLASANLELIIGRRHLLQLFFLAGAAGGLVQLGAVAALDRPVPLAGAAAAAFGVFFALTSIMPDLELAPFIGFPLPFWLKIKHAAFALIGACTLSPLLQNAGAFAQEQAVGCLGGCFVGWIYMRCLGFGGRLGPRRQALAVEPGSAPAPVFSQASGHTATAGEDRPELPAFTERERRMTAREYISEQIDPILDKISLHGIACLTREERRILEKGRDKITRPGT